MIRDTYIPHRLAARLVPFTFFFTCIFWVFSFIREYAIDVNDLDNVLPLTIFAILGFFFFVYFVFSYLETSKKVTLKNNSLYVHHVMRTTIIPIDQLEKTLIYPKVIKKHRLFRLLKNRICEITVTFLRKDYSVAILKINNLDPRSIYDMTSAYEEAIAFFERNNIGVEIVDSPEL